MANLTDEALDFTITFDNDTKQVRWTDNLDYANYNVPAATIRGLGQGFGITGSLFVDKMSPVAALISDLNTTTKNSIYYDLPVDSLGEIVNGAYSFLYAVYTPYTAVNQAVTSFSASNTIVIAGQDWSWLEAGDTFAVTLATTPANNGAKTVVSAIYNGSQTIVTVSTAITVEAGGAAVINFAITKQYEKTITQSFTGCDEVTPAITMTNDCTQTQFGTITATDTTDYGTQTLVSRTITLEAPNGLYPVPAEDPWTTTATSESALTVSTLATGTWTAKLICEVSYTGTDGLVVLYSFGTDGSGALFTSEVTCSTQLCDIVNCISNFITTTITCNNPTPVQLKETAQLGLLLAAYQVAMNCGETDKMAAYVTEIEGILGDSCTCGSADGTPTWINNNAASGTTTIEELIAEIAVLTNIVTNLEQSCTPIFNASWAIGNDTSFAQIQPFQIAKEFFALGPDAPYYKSLGWVEMIIDFKVATSDAYVSIYNQTDGAYWYNQNVGGTATSGSVKMIWTSWNSNPRCTIVTEFEAAGNTYIHDESILSTADWDLDADLLVNITPSNYGSFPAAIVYSNVTVIGYKIPIATS
jgi:hypothetical protein